MNYDYHPLLLFWLFLSANPQQLSKNCAVTNHLHNFARPGPSPHFHVLAMKQSLNSAFEITHIVRGHSTDLIAIFIRRIAIGRLILPTNLSRCRVWAKKDAEALTGDDDNGLTLVSGLATPPSYKFSTHLTYNNNSLSIFPLIFFSVCAEKYSLSGTFSSRSTWIFSQ